VQKVEDPFHFMRTAIRLSAQDSERHSIARSLTGNPTVALV